MPQWKAPFGQGGFNRPTGATGAKPVQPSSTMQNPLLPERPHNVECTQFFFLNMDVPFTGVAGQNTSAGTFLEQFPMEVRGAWTDLTSARVLFTEQKSGEKVSPEAVPLLNLAGASDKVHPMYYWHNPLLLPANAQLRGAFTNDGAEQAGKVVFFCSRPDLKIDVPVVQTKEYRIVLDLGLDSGDTTTIQTAQSQQVDYDLLIYGASSTVSGVDIQFLDTRQNIQWSAEKLPIGAFAGIDTEVQPIMRYAKPYYLPRNSTIKASYVNSGAEDNGFVTFVCQRILY